MDFIALLICLAIERWTSLGRQIRDFRLLEKYIDFFDKTFPKQTKAVSGFLFVLAVVIPLALLVGFFWYIFSLFFVGLLNILFSTIVLIYCLGTFEPQITPHLLKNHYPTKQKREIVGMMMQANQNIFAVLFWFAVLGPAGAIIYRLIILLIDKYRDTAIGHAATVMIQWGDWIPVRLLGVGCALVSHFKGVLVQWGHHLLTRPSANEEMLAECGFAALELDRKRSELSVEAIRQATMALIDRTLALWLIILAAIILL